LDEIFYQIYTLTNRVICDNAALIITEAQKMSELIPQRFLYKCRLCDVILEPKEGMSMVKCSCGAIGVDILSYELGMMRMQGSEYIINLSEWLNTETGKIQKGEG